MNGLNLKAIKWMIALAVTSSRMVAVIGLLLFVSADLSCQTKPTTELLEPSWDWDRAMMTEDPSRVPPLITSVVWVVPSHIPETPQVDKGVTALWVRIGSKASAKWLDVVAKEGGLQTLVIEGSGSLTLSAIQTLIQRLRLHALAVVGVTLTGEEAAEKLTLTRLAHLSLCKVGGSVNAVKEIIRVTLPEVVVLRQVCHQERVPWAPTLGAQVSSLAIEHCGALSAELFAKANDCQYLHSLRIRGEQASERWEAVISKCAQLGKVDLDVWDDSIYKHVVAAKELSELSLRVHHGNTPTSHQLIAIGKELKLKRLSLTGSKLRRDAVEAVGALSSLEHLQIEAFGWREGDECDISKWSALTQLISLSIVGVSFNVQALCLHASTHKRLRALRLDVVNDSMTCEDAVLVLRGCTELVDLDVRVVELCARLGRVVGESVNLASITVRFDTIEDKVSALGWKATRVTLHARDSSKVRAAIVARLIEEMPNLKVVRVVNVTVGGGALSNVLDRGVLTSLHLVNCGVVDFAKLRRPEAETMGAITLLWEGDEFDQVFEKTGVRQSLAKHNVYALPRLKVIDQNP